MNKKIYLFTTFLLLTVNCFASLYDSFNTLEKEYDSALPVLQVPVERVNANEVFRYKLFRGEIPVGSELYMDFFKKSGGDIEKIEDGVLLHKPLYNNDSYLEVFMPSESNQQWFIGGNILTLKKAAETFCSYSYGFSGRKSVCIKRYRSGALGHYIVKIEFFAAKLRGGILVFTDEPEIYYGKISLTEIRQQRHRFINRYIY
jgi:hypothetical protein